MFFLLPGSGSGTGSVLEKTWIQIRKNVYASETLTVPYLVLTNLTLGPPPALFQRTVLYVVIFPAIRSRVQDLRGNSRVYLMLIMLIATQKTPQLFKGTVQ